MIEQNEVVREHWSPRMTMFLNYIFDWNLPCEFTCSGMSITSDGFMIGYFSSPEGVHEGAFHGEASVLVGNLQHFMEDYPTCDAAVLNVLLWRKFTDYSQNKHMVKVAA